MKTRILLLISFFAAATLSLTAQQYTAYEYWKMENDSSYTRLQRLSDAGESLSADDAAFLGSYKKKLGDYFSAMPDSEKAFYFQNRSAWSKNTMPVPGPVVRQDPDIFEGEKSLFTKYLTVSGVFGYLYGWATIGILGIENEGTIAGLPFLTAGVSTLLPLAYVKDRNVTYNSLQLAIHGKTMGGLQGAALGILFAGNKTDENPELILGVATLSSITMGHVGFAIGRKNAWSKGKVGLLTHYGTLIPFEGIALTGAFASEHPSAYAASFMAGGAAGYLLGNHIAGKYDYTKGDIVSTQALTLLGGVLGLGLIPKSHWEEDMNSADILFPAFGALAGSLASHPWTKGARLTNQQGRNIALATTGGSLAGMGVILLFMPESPNPYFLASFTGGVTAYSLMMGRYKKQNAVSGNLTGSGNSDRKWNLNLMPQNILFNKSIAEASLARP